MLRRGRPGHGELVRPADEAAATNEFELSVYMKVWRLLYPDAEVSLVEAWPALWRIRTPS